MLTSNLACGPMSREIIEAVFRHSHKFGIQLMLICSRNQVDINSGYVFTTKQYMDYIAEMRHKYSRSDVIICRDHCGPGFVNGDNSCDSVIRTIIHDIENGFDLIHIDLCHLKYSNEEKLQKTIDLMRFALSINPNIMFEIGTDENIGIADDDVNRIVTNILKCQEVANPIFYVVQTGSLVREIGNTLLFEAEKISKIHRALQKYGVKLKEHNADYLTSTQIALRSGIVDAMNIAPQLGVVQTSYVLSQALIYGINTEPFMREVIYGGEWAKWTRNQDDFSLCALIAGHYHFSGPAYRKLIEELSQKIDVRENIIKQITRVIEHYLFSLG